MNPAHCCCATLLRTLCSFCILLLVRYPAGDLSAKSGGELLEPSIAPGNAPVYFAAVHIATAGRALTSHPVLRVAVPREGIGTSMVDALLDLGR